MEGLKLVPHFRYEKFDSVNQRYQIADIIKYDRNTSVETIKLILKLGFKITRD